MRVLALDYGSARCGAALSDPSGTLATPLGAVPRPRSAAGMEALRALVGEHGAERVVVGLPLSLSGGETEQTRRTRAFAAALGRALGGRVPVELYDERLTTRMAQRVDRASGAQGRADEDSRAAALLLQDWLRARGAGCEQGAAPQAAPAQAARDSRPRGSRR
jgi:putative Holliday junction resolvase